jgi:hypothetical protein
VDVTLEVWDDIPHIWQAFVSFLPEAAQALDQCGQSVWKHTI